jgi:hypothetical protein
MSHTAQERHAESFLDHDVFHTIAAAFETYPELDVDEVLEVCRPALRSALCEFRGGPEGQHSGAPPSNRNKTMSPRDRAAVTARGVIQMVRRSATEKEVASYLRGEFTDVIREHVDAMQAFADEGQNRRKQEP